MLKRNSQRVRPRPSLCVCAGFCVKHEFTNSKLEIPKKAKYVEDDLSGFQDVRYCAQVRFICPTNAKKLFND